MNPLILFPMNGNSREGVEVALQSRNHDGERIWNVLGFIDDDIRKHLSIFCGISCLGGRNCLNDYPSSKVLAVPGRPENYHKRRDIIESLNLSSSQFATVIHPSACLGLGVEIGYNTLIMAGCVITANSKIGNHVVILPNTVVSHDSVIGDYSLVGSNVSISGGVSVGINCYIGSGTRIISEISVGDYSLLGLGSVVLRNVPPRSVYVGVPAKKLKEVVC